VLDSSNAPFYRWFPGGKTNTAYNALDRNVEQNRGDQLALIYDSAITGARKGFTYKELLHEVETAAGMLRNHGVKTGDTVIIYMPMIPETIISMLACARIGAIHR
jgi:propionyl-CoA synthetase